jgi:transcriptional regulator with XRE-family HTH domain
LLSQSCYLEGEAMTTGDQIRTARERAGFTQQQLGTMLGVSMRTVGNWERGASVPRNKLGAIKHLLDGQAGTDAPALRDASDAELLAEIARRFARQATEGGGERARSAPKTRAGESPAPIPLRPLSVADETLPPSEDAVAALEDPTISEELEAQHQEP